VLLPAVAAIAGSLLIAVPWLVWTLERDQIATRTGRLEGEAHVVGETLPWTSGPELDRASAALAERLNARITVIAPDGTVLGESTPHTAPLDSHADRPEVRAALADGFGHAVRWSKTIDRRLLYGAWRQDGDGTSRIIRIAVPIRSMTEHLLALRAPVGTGLATAAVLGLVVAWLVSTAMRRRIARLVRIARALASGERPPPMGPERSDDLGVLEQQIAGMARDVDATLGAMRIERERLEAILRGMVEGVIVTDLDGHVVLLNARARQLLALAPGVDPVGRSLLELARDPGIAEIPRRIVAGDVVLRRDVTLGGSPGRSLQVNAARLTGEDGRPFGLVLVLHDVSELRRLETVRRDFVANVSHELRTPLTAIKGYAETLLGGAGDEPGTRARFLTIIDRHAERLGRLIDDLLTLSDLEFGRTPLRRRALPLAPAIDDVVQILADGAERRGLTLSAAVAPDTPLADADGDRVRQVLVNLIDNAVKYTPEGGRVQVDARRGSLAGAPAVELTVVDTGVGIPSHDLPRLTERFFRVDRARSRELGGTGLGLAIVKHIVQAHDGRLEIESTLGHGTTVRVTLPAARAA
jgi:two-component system phosphate regulon sensor histidine kinase PhoR